MVPMTTTYRSDYAVLVVSLCSISCGSDGRQATRADTSRLLTAALHAAEEQSQAPLVIYPRFLPRTFDSIPISRGEVRALSGRDFQDVPGSQLIFADTLWPFSVLECLHNSTQCPGKRHVEVQFSLPVFTGDSARISCELRGYRLFIGSQVISPGFFERSILRFRREGTRWRLIGRRIVTVA